MQDYEYFHASKSSEDESNPGISVEGSVTADPMDKDAFYQPLTRASEIEDTPSHYLVSLKALREVHLTDGYFTV